MKKIMQWKEVVAIVVATISILMWVDSGKSLAEDNNKEIGKQQTKMTEQSNILTALSALVVTNTASRTAMLQMMGIDPEKAKKWSKMAKEPIVNDKGEPVIGVPWVIMSENVQLGVAYQFQKNDSGDVVEVVVDTLWDVREE